MSGVPLTRRVVEILETDGGWLTFEGIKTEYQFRFTVPVNEMSLRRTLPRLERRGVVVSRILPGELQVAAVRRVEYRIAA